MSKEDQEALKAAIAALSFEARYEAKEFEIEGFQNVALFGGNRF